MNDPTHQTDAPPTTPVLRTLTARGTYTRQPVLADDGGTLGLDWWGGGDRPQYGAPDTPVCLFIREWGAGLVIRGWGCGGGLGVCSLGQGQC